MYMEFDPLLLLEGDDDAFLGCGACIFEFRGVGVREAVPDNIPDTRDAGMPGTSVAIEYEGDKSNETLGFNGPGPALEGGGDTKLGCVVGVMVLSPKFEGVL